MVLLNIDPGQTGFFGFLFFYLSLFLALTGTIALVGLLIRSYTLKHEMIFRLVTRSFRQGLFFSVLIIGTLLLQSQRLLTWWNTIFLVIGLTALEFFFVSDKRRRVPLRENYFDQEDIV